MFIPNNSKINKNSSIFFKEDNLDKWPSAKVELLVEEQINLLFKLMVNLLRHLKQIQDILKKRLQILSIN